MAGTNGRAVAGIREALLERGRSFSFFQAMRHLRNLTAEEGGAQGNGGRPVDGVRVRPSLSLSFAGPGIEGIEERAPGQWLLTANILGLYGTGSPLPVFYTEDLFGVLEGEQDAARDFLDIINQRLYELLYDGWAKSQAMMKVVEEGDTPYGDRFFSLTGLGRTSLRTGLRNPWGLIRYSGLLSQGNRSASGLRTLLSDALGGLSVQVIQALKRQVPISTDQQCVLGVSGNALGVTCYLGTEFEDATGAILIRIGPLSEEAYRSFLPGTDGYRRVVALTRFYLSSPISFALEVVMEENAKKETTQPGQTTWARLGLDTWVFSGESPGELSTRFYP
ncbi:type VI secretion system baseplate subunit TssG [Desulfoluna spongiiphila]|uniref:type VI secretion system baseplate subunit TssG n=1 Tax=Desulfoluna spongiiphila TaxID=419481 RepID=UPI0012587BCC|nr:type VI secretion system baseplate subunit TssG [Desulfoluna spongiiphila]VVS91536.1 type vi secretion tssg-like [Desulfoluna spongiiphila]